MAKQSNQASKKVTKAESKISKVYIKNYKINFKQEQVKKQKIKMLLKEPLLHSFIIFLKEDQI